MIYTFDLGMVYHVQSTIKKTENVRANKALTGGRTLQRPSSNDIDVFVGVLWQRSLAYDFRRTTTGTTCHRIKI